MNHSTKDGLARTRRPFGTFSEILALWLARFGEHYQKATSEISVDTYREGLSDLTAEELDAACGHALKTSEWMPTVATIRKSFAAISYNEQRHERPAYLDEPPNCERPEWKALMESMSTDKTTEPPSATPVTQKKIVMPRQSTLSIAEQKEILRKRGFLP